MGDRRFRGAFTRVRDATDREQVVRSLSDEDVVSALAASAEEQDPLISNILATEAHNRMYRAQTVYRHLGEGIAMTDPAGRIILLNPSAQRILRASDDFLGRDLHDAVHGFCVDPRCSIRRALQTGEADQEEGGFLSAFDGAIVPVAFTVNAIRRTDGVEGIVLLVRDATAQRASMEILRAAEAKVRRVLDDVAEGILRVDTTGTITYANAAAVRILGTNDIEGRKFYDPAWVMHDPDGTLIPVRETPIFRALHEKVPVQADAVVVKRGDGAEVILRISVRPMKDPLDRVEWVVVSFTDITAPWQQAETTSRLAAVVEGSVDPIIGHDLEGHITTWNPAAERVYGYTASEAIGRPISMLFPPEGDDEEVRRFVRLRAGESVEPRETTRRTKDGRTLVVRITMAPVRDDSGRLVGVAKIHHDLTAFRRAETRASLLLDAAPDGFVVADERGVIVMVNAQAERMFGWRREELIGQKVEVLVPTELRTAHAGDRAGFTSAPRRRPMGVGLELSGQHKDGSRFPVEIALSPVRMEDQTLVVASIRDLREHLGTNDPHGVRAAQEETRRSRQAASQKDPA